MEPQAALTILATLAEITGTILAIFCAVVAFMLDRYSTMFFRRRVVTRTTLMIFVVFSLLIVVSLTEMSRLDMTIPTDNNRIFGIIGFFAFGLFLLGFFIICVASDILRIQAQKRL